MLRPQVETCTGLGLQGSQNQVKKAVKQAKKDGQPVHFASLMDLCHLKHSVFAKHLQAYKNDIGYWAVSSEQGASASQVAAARILGTKF